MSELRKELELREQFLKQLEAEKLKALAHAPDGFLRASKRGKGVQYYLKTDETGSNGKYLKQEESNLIRALAQKEYDSKILKAVMDERKRILHLKNIYDKNLTQESIFQFFSSLKRGLIKPTEMPIEEYVRQWKEEPFTQLAWDDHIGAFLSDRNERMRSKSEIIIADMLYQRGIPYRYEARLQLGREIFHPDFTILRRSTRALMYWEHLGRLDKPDYRERNVKKLNSYSKNGIHLGKNLILTFETENQPLDLDVVRIMIEQFCL